MLLTSYFANAKNFPKNKHIVSISRFTPKWFQPDEIDLSLAPSISLLNNYKNSLIDDNEYEKIYKEETLSKLDPAEVFEKYKNSILLCYEKSEDFCHRNIVSSWLRENGFKATELVNKVNLAIIGSRDFKDYNTLKKIVDIYIEKYSSVKIISGGANGADKLAERYAKDNNLDIDIYYADWDKHGKSAGYKRNFEIWENCDEAIAFWDGKSKGTKHSFGISKRMNKPLYVFNYKTRKWLKF